MDYVLGRTGATVSGASRAAARAGLAKSPP